MENNEDFFRPLAGAPATELLLPIQVFQWLSTGFPMTKIMDNLNISRFPTKSQQQIMRKANLRVKWRAGKGRCLVASRDINPLELIMFDAAIVTGPQVSRSSSLLAPQSGALSRLVVYMSNFNFKRVSPQLSVRSQVVPQRAPRLLV